ncbi:MAG: GNAT family N-acetyltransferase [Streptococcaceae bacterium]|jgi:ribosomal protein S18 acetylase RimI-like enzyme|nr:GNAT family N-acetyltransferase [Streptococcaceae bacterium]
MKIQKTDPLETLKEVDQLIIEDAQSKGHVLDSSISLAFSATIEGEFVGGIKGTLQGTNLHINGLAVVHPQHDQQIGSKLLQKTEDEARKLGVLVITLSTLDYQALGFYKKMGFHVLGEVKHVPEKDVTKYYLGKYL